MNAFCRTCMHQFPKISMDNMEKFSIFETPHLADKLMQCSKLSVQATDEYPNSICGKCFEKVCDFHAFQKMCLESLKTFKELLEIEKDSRPENFAIEMTLSNKHIIDSESKHDVVLNNVIAEFDAEYLIIQDYNESEFEDNHSGLIEVLGDVEADDVDYKRVGSEHIANYNSNSDLHQTVAKVENEQLSTNVKGSNSAEILFEDPFETEGEEERMAGTLSEIDELDPQDHVAPLQGNAAEIFKYPHYCEFCPMVFASEHRLAAHKRQHQGKGSYPCTRKDCTLSFRRVCDLRQHVRDHDGIPREIYKCDVDNCGKEYTTKSAINVHMRKRHHFGEYPGSRKYICDVCGVHLSNARSLQDHHFLHVDKSYWPFACDFENCTARFRKFNQLKEHKNRHAGIKPFTCPHCDKRFCTSSNLSVHVNYHTQEKQWPCHVCARIFFTPSNLKNHMQREHDPDQSENRYPCRMCDKTLSSITARKFHEMRHTGEKPYICSDCGRGFTQRTLLRTHQKMHS